MEHHLVDEGIGNSIYESYEQARRFNEQMKHSMLSVDKLKSRLPGGKVYEYLNYEWHCFCENTNWKCFKALVRYALYFCLGDRITRVFGGMRKDERERMISTFSPNHEQILFHWTSQEKVQSILDNGLCSGQNRKYVYMTDDAEYIARNGYFFYKVDRDKRDIHFVLLQIDAYELSKKYKIFCVDALHEYAVTVVPAKYITVFE